MLHIFFLVLGAYLLLVALTRDYILSARATDIEYQCLLGAQYIEYSSLGLVRAPRLAAF